MLGLFSLRFFLECAILGKNGKWIMKDFDWELLHSLHKNPNMTKAVNILYIAQPSLTKRLQYIEAEFDVTIVARTPKGLALPPRANIWQSRQCTCAF